MLCSECNKNPAILFYKKIENGKVYTIEGNSEDKCQKHEYILKDNVILGYGII